MRPEGPAAVETGGRMTGKVLLVEDEEGLRVATAKMLRKQGLSITEASDGWAAIELIHKQEQEIDLILLDMTIPGASSADVFAEAQRLRPQPGSSLLRHTAGKRPDLLSMGRNSKASSVSHINSPSC